MDHDFLAFARRTLPAELIEAHLPEVKRYLLDLFSSDRETCFLVGLRLGGWSHSDAEVAGALGVTHEELVRIKARLDAQTRTVLIEHGVDPDAALATGNLWATKSGRLGIGAQTW
jgi:hypothetical protein